MNNYCGPPTSHGGLFETDTPHPARMYDYFLGGKDWYEVDQQAAEQALAVYPFLRQAAVANRGFMHRSARTLVAEYGIRQFLDIGTGIPTKPNLHQIAQQVAAESRIVYADNDLTVLEHADALMHSSPEGRTAYVHGDFCDGQILDDPKLLNTIDLTKPVALSLVALVHFVAPADDPVQLVHRYMEKLAPGSFLVLSHATADHTPEAIARVAKAYEGATAQLYPRSEACIREFFGGLELIDPGLVVPYRWRPTQDTPQLKLSECPVWAGVGRKP